MDGLTLIDTDILIDAGRDIQDAVEFLERVETQARLTISVITQMELIVGCQSKRELRSVDKFLTRFESINLNEHISSLAVELLRTYRLSHGLLIADAFIAATALYLNAPLSRRIKRIFALSQI